MFNKILIANRGEIACRIIKTARCLGIETVAVYSTADRNSLHVRQADHAYCIGEPAALTSYLNIAALMAVAIESGAQAIHPGYGFLSENPHLARACMDANIVFIGPGIAAMEAMASKQLAKQMLEKTTVPLTPGYHGHDQSDERLLKEATTLGFPVLIKAAAGGGGKGMRAVYKKTEFEQCLAGARREAKANFADDTMLIEKLLTNPRHIEMQIMADNHGNIVHLFERDCSIQRRHQKIIEEAPAINLSDTLRQGLAEAAIAVARAIDYSGAGTVEFLVAEDQYYFMEMNTRLQVEHPVTEMITNCDLVEWQLRIAANEMLPLTQNEVSRQGHAIECRIYAEDPNHGFMPSIGELHFLKEPKGEGIRIDTGVVCGSNITMYYDPMVAKLIAWGENRSQALHRLNIGLKHYHVGGVKTNIPFLQAITQHAQFIAGNVTTDFLAIETIEMRAPEHRLGLLMAASTDYLSLSHPDNQALINDTFAWQMHQKSQWPSRYMIEGKQYDLMVLPLNHEQFQVHLNEEIIELRAKRIGNQLYLEEGTQTDIAYVQNFSDHVTIYTDYGPLTIHRFNWQHQAIQAASGQDQLTAPMPATVVAILKNKGDKVKAGDALIVLEAMKMEHTIRAPEDVHNQKLHMLCENHD